jgi:hypothetical protein
MQRHRLDPNEPESYIQQGSTKSWNFKQKTQSEWIDNGPCSTSMLAHKGARRTLSLASSAQNRSDFLWLILPHYKPGEMEESQARTTSQR